jgi:enamine deaminase RidA (YjgF/YER057c/UK114 family)
MSVFIDRRQLLKSLGVGGTVLGAAGVWAPAAPVLADTQTPSSQAAPLFMRIPLRNSLIPHAGETSMELYHRHPHDPREEIIQPEDIRLQTRLVMRNHKEVLDWVGLGWRHVVKLTRYQKRMDETPQIDAVLRSYFKDWQPPQTIYQIEGLSSPQARLEIDMWVVPAETRIVVG